MTHKPQHKPKHMQRRQWPLASAGAALALTCLGAAAQTPPEDADGDGSGLHLTLGAGVLSGPKYPGASARETRVVPLVSVRYGRYFLGGAPGTGVPLGLGVNLVESPAWRLGVALGPDLSKPRQASDAQRLTGLGDIAATTHLALFGSYSQPWWSLRGNVVTDVGGKHEGTTASLELEGRYELTKRFVLSAGPGLTWADKRYNQTFFGINATQATNSGLARYDTGSGLNTLKFSLGLDYRIDPRWLLGARASVESLRGDAKHSPITSEANPHTIGIFSGYRF